MSMPAEPDLPEVYQYPTRAVKVDVVGPVNVRELPSRVAAVFAHIAPGRPGAGLPPALVRLVGHDPKRKRLTVMAQDPDDTLWFSTKGTGGAPWPGGQPFLWDAEGELWIGNDATSDVEVTCVHETWAD